MTLEELKTRHTAVLRAINKIENGAQEYRIVQRKVSYGDLAKLNKQDSDLSHEISRLERPRSTVAVLGRRR